MVPTLANPPQLIAEWTPRQVYNRVFGLWTQLRDALGARDDWGVATEREMMAADTALSRLAFAIQREAQVDEMARYGRIDGRPPVRHLSYARVPHTLKLDGP